MRYTTIRIQGDKLVELTVVFESDITNAANQISWEQGMWLLLNACDVEMSVQAVFMRHPQNVQLSLGKKLQQLDLYEVTSFVCPQSQAVDTELANSKILSWDWLNQIDHQDAASKLENSRQIISV